MGVKASMLLSAYTPSVFLHNCPATMGGATGACEGIRRTPHFYGLYPAGSTTQFTLYTSGVHQLAAPQKLRKGKNYYFIIIIYLFG